MSFTHSPDYSLLQPSGPHTSTLLAGLAFVVSYIVADILGDGLIAALGTALRFLYHPPRGYLLLPLTWIAALLSGATLMASSEREAVRTGWIVSFFALAGLGLLGTLTLRDGRSAARRQSPVVTRVSLSLSLAGRSLLTLGGLACFALAFWTYQIERLSGWETIAGACLFGAGLLYSGVMARLPAWLRPVLDVETRDLAAERQPADERRS